MRTPSRLLAAPAVLVVGALALAGCSGEPSSTPRPTASSSSAAASPSAPSPPAPSAPSGDATSSPSTPPAAGAPQGPPAPRRLVDAGISVEVPAGWSAASLDPASQQAAVAAEKDPQVAAFLKSRLEGMAGTGGVMYLYDLSRLDQGVLSAVEVYRYPGTDPQAIADQKITPAMAQAGLNPEGGTVDLPAGKAVTVTGTLAGPSVTLTNAVALLVLGPSVVSLNSTFADPTADQVRAVLSSVQAA